MYALLVGIGIDLLVLICVPNPRPLSIKCRSYRSRCAVMHIYCVIKGESISPRTMKTDTVEWVFGDAQQMVLGGSTNKLTAAGFDRADKKASTFNAAKFSLVGNNLTGDNIFGRNKRF